MADPAEVAAEVLASRRYRHVSPELVRRVSEAEAAAASDRRGAVKAVKRKLHQVVGAFDLQPPYERLQAGLAAAFASDDPRRVEAACLEALRCHASTRERIPILAELYRQVLALTGPPRVVLDLGCGLGPLALPWMGLPPGATYHAYDADALAVGLVSSFLELAGLPALAEARDVIARPPTEPADVALLLKLLPTLEQEAAGSGLRLLDALAARFVVVSFPVRSLGGREKGMAAHYERQLREMLTGRPWGVERLAFATELVFVIDKSKRK